MTLKQLEAFYWAATCFTFAIAAEKLCLSVSSLSKRISELETALGRPLFDRSGHRAVLSEAGAILLPRARALLMGAERLVDDLRPSDVSAGHLRVGAGELTAMTWLAGFIRRIHEGKPNVCLDCVVAVGDTLEQRLAAGELDIAIVAARSSNPALSSARISQARFGWYAGEARRRAALTPDAFEEAALIGLPVGSGITRLVDDWLHARGIVPRRRIVCNHWGAAAALIREGLGLGALPVGWTANIASSYKLHALECEPNLPPLEYFVQWRGDDYRMTISWLRALAEATADFE